MQKTKNIANTYYVLSKNDNNRLHALQAIIYDDGTCCVGIDCWRKLDKHDTASYLVEEYSSKQKLFQNYDILKGKTNRRHY